MKIMMIRARLAVRRVIAQIREQEDGLATVEYAIMVVAVAGFAGLMVILLKSDWAKDMIQGIIEGALNENS